MKNLKGFVLPFFILFAVGCATAYQKEGLTGGYREELITAPNTWRVVFGGNGHTTRETAQTYWLYRAAEFTLEKGYDYFEILNSYLKGSFLWGEDFESYNVTQLIFIPMESAPKPTVELDIRMHKKPYDPHPPKSFDARALLKTLKPMVLGKKCDKENICPHEKTYLK